MRAHGNSLLVSSSKPQGRHLESTLDAESRLLLDPAARYHLGVEPRERVVAAVRPELGAVQLVGAKTLLKFLPEPGAAS